MRDSVCGKIADFSIVTLFAAKGCGDAGDTAPMISDNAPTTAKLAPIFHAGLCSRDQAALAISFADASARPVKALSVIDSSPSVWSSRLAAALMPSTPAQRVNVP
jgi:hypothetical protein